MRGLNQLIATKDWAFGLSLADRLGGWKKRRKAARRWNRSRREFPVPVNIAHEIQEVLSRIPFYWTPPEKQVFLASIILENRLMHSVEIGVYTGGSIIPQAIAMKFTGGCAIGIDPYSDVEAEQSDNRDMIESVDAALLRPDRDKMYDELIELIQRSKLSPSCRILRLTSNDAASHIKGRIDLLHIDGNHDYESVVTDLKNYLPKLQLGGYLVMDDINWGTIAPLYHDVREQMECVYETATWGCCRKTAEDIAVPRHSQPSFRE